MSEVGERIKGGAVSEERSPEKEAMDLRNEDQLPRWAAGTAPAYMRVRRDVHDGDGHTHFFSRHSGRMRSRWFGE